MPETLTRWLAQLDREHLASEIIPNPVTREPIEVNAECCVHSRSVAPCDNGETNRACSMGLKIDELEAGHVLHEAQGAISHCFASHRKGNKLHNNQGMPKSLKAA